MIDDTLIDVVIFPSGRIAEFKPPYTLELLQKAVGGYIEQISLNDDIIMIVNEEGQIQNLQPNIKATMVYRMETKVRYLIFGNAIITRRENIK